MAERRMFAIKIIDSDAFIDMPLSTQALYFHLAMRADDDGLINNPKKVQRMICASDDDLKMLVTKQFIIPFASGIVAICHWPIHNRIRNDRYKPSIYTKEKSALKITENGSYAWSDILGIPSDDPVVYPMDAQVSPEKGSLDEDITTTTGEAPSVIEVYKYFKEWLNENAAKEAEKFHAYNTKRGWDCMPNWKVTADLWIARIEENKYIKRTN